MKKKCFKKTVSWALSIVMSATMAVTPVLADTFTDGSQLIVSEDAGEETPAATISDAEDEGMMEPEHTFEIEDNCEDSGRTGFSSENEASGRRQKKKRLFTWIRHLETMVILERVLSLP